LQGAIGNRQRSSAVGYVLFQRIAGILQYLFRTLPLRDVVEENSHYTAIRPAEWKRIYVKPASGQLDLFLNAHSFASERNVGVNINPRFICVREEL
jgi:hypothetical protein